MKINHHPPIAWSAESIAGNRKWIMQLTSIIAGILTSIYGSFNAWAGLAQLKLKKIPPASAWLMLGFGLWLVFSGAALAIRTSFSWIFLAIGLIAIHILTIRNGLYLFGKINPRHHLLRLIISIALVVLALLSQN